MDMNWKAIDVPKDPRDQHECYCCGSYGPYMNIVAGTEDGNLWWCDDPAWCRARLVAEKLKNDSRIADVS